MNERIMSKLYKHTKNVRIAEFFTKIIMFILNCITIVKYYTTKKTFKGESKKVLEDREFQPKEIIRDNEKIYDLSIIIPAYNCQETIESCLNSIIKQKGDYKYEIIVINDGSSDNTAEKLSSYQSYSNIRVISQENRGIACARNKGLELAKGKYIMFVDSDDAIPEKTINNLLKEAFMKNFDIVEGNYYNVSSDGTKMLGKPLWKKEFAVDLTSNKEFIREIKGFPWGRIYSHKLWYDVEFPIGFEYEDTIIRFTIFRKAKSFSYINQPVYEYTLSNTSISTRLKGSIKSLDTYYVAKYLMANNTYINIPFDSVSYKIVLNQFSSLLYYRSIGLEEEEIQYILEQAAETLSGIEKYCPKLSIKDKMLKKSILDKNLYKWEICCKWR